MLFSIVIPIYNTQPVFILEALNSIRKINISQSLYEVIIVNDGSNNIETLNFLKNHNFTSEKIFHKTNNGVSSARNYGISKAIGKYIYPLDSDDVLHDDFNIFIKELDNENIDVLYGNLIFFGDINKFHKVPNFNRLRLFYDQNMIPSCSFFKKKVWEDIGGYDESFECIEDWDFWVRCAIKNVRFKKIEKCAYNYRVLLDGKSLSQTKSHLSNYYIKKMRSKIPPIKLSKNELKDYTKEYLLTKNSTLKTKEQHSQYIEQLEQKIKDIKTTFFYKVFVKLELNLKSKLKTILSLLK